VCAARANFPSTLLSLSSSLRTPPAAYAGGDLQNPAPPPASLDFFSHPPRLVRNSNGGFSYHHLAVSLFIPPLRCLVLLLACCFLYSSQSVSSHYFLWQAVQDRLLALSCPFLEVVFMGSRALFSLWVTSPPPFLGVCGTFDVSLTTPLLRFVSLYLHAQTHNAWHFFPFSAPFVSVFVSGLSTCILNPVHSFRRCPTVFCIFGHFSD